jgi:hypothetical protein
VNLTALGLDPHSLARRRRPVAFADMVDTGGTFANLFAVLRAWVDDEGAQWDVIRTKLRFVGLVSRSTRGFKTWRWHQRAAWTAQLPPGAIVNVSAEPALIQVMAGLQPKLTSSFEPEDWARPARPGPRHDARTLTALAEAVSVFDLGRDPAERDALVRRLAAEPAFAQGWLRSLALELRAGRATPVGAAPGPHDPAAGRPQRPGGGRL